jgi:hypothetical protein
MNLEEIGIIAGNWVDSAQDRDYWRALVNAALNLRVPKAYLVILLFFPRLHSVGQLVVHPPSRILRT